MQKSDSDSVCSNTPVVENCEYDLIFHGKGRRKNKMLKESGERQAGCDYIIMMGTE